MSHDDLISYKSITDSTNAASIHLRVGGAVSSSAPTGAPPPPTAPAFSALNLDGLIVLATRSLMALLGLLAYALLATMAGAQDNDTPWFWIMADSKNSAIVCPGRCLAVNDSANTGVYTNKRVGFVACKVGDADSTTSGASASASNNNQQWLRDDDDDVKETRIRINSTGETNPQSAQPQLLCLQPDPKANRSLTVATCTEEKHQKWIVTDNSVASLAFSPPRYLAMTHQLAGFLDPADGSTAWRKGSIVEAQKNSSLTTTFSMVDGTLDRLLQPPPPPPDNDPLDSRNFIRNGGFEQSSSDFSRAMSNVSLSPNDIFGVCDWRVMKADTYLQGESNPAPPQGNRSLYIKDGIVEQIVATNPGAFYTLSFKAHVAAPSRDSNAPAPAPASESDNCRGSDTFVVKPYPSTSVHMTVEVGDGNWSTKHVSFQAIGAKVNVVLKGCADCGCFVDEMNLMQVIDRAPFPPPPSPQPLPMKNPGQFADGKRRPDFNGRRPQTDRLSNWAVAGVVVGAAALFFVIGAVFFGVMCVKEKKRSETEMTRPPEWSIQTTTPAQSDRGRRNSEGHADGSNPHNSQSSAATPTSRSPISVHNVMFCIL